MRQSPFCFLLLLLSAIFLLPSCGKDDDATPPANPSFKGDFVSVAHTTKGIASIDSNATTLTLTNFKTDSGPDLNIYLATSTSNVTAAFIDLGNIKGVKGNYTYTVPAGTDFTAYKYVIVWCVDFDVNFGYAELVMQ
jgi:hypothetical protein